MRNRIVFCLLLVATFLPGEIILAQNASSAFMQRIYDLKERQLPPAGFIHSLEKQNDPKFARAVCLHGGSRRAVCQNKLNPTVGWALCILVGRAVDECNLPKMPSVGFGLCMAAGRDVTDCNYVQGSTSGYGLCMASGRSFHECSAPSQPSLAFGYCMGRGEDVSNCLNLGYAQTK